MSITEELEKKLYGAKFRLLNEKMYKSGGLSDDEAKKYHVYYTEQSKKWPQHPRNGVFDKLKDINPHLQIADLGCGGAEIATMFPNVKSYDKYPANNTIIKADITSVPTADKSFDIVINCLSLMTNYISKVIVEVNRILKIGGTWYIAEVSSRIKNNRSLIDGLEKFGFKLIEADTRNTHFCIIVLEKIKDTSFPGKLPEIRLKPCIYKKR